MMREIEIELHEASANNDILALEILLKNKDININLENVLGLTPLMHAAKFGYAKIVEMLIKAGADINKADKLFITPLMSAAANGHYDVVKLLIENKADVNKKDVNNTTALHYASSSNYTDIIKLLVENKADINAKTDLHITPIMYSCQLSNYEAVKFLVDNGAKLDECDIYEENVLHYAISSGNIEIVEYILNKQDLEIPRYALTIASISGNLSLVHYIHSKLKDDRKENIFSSAFISAAHNGHLDIVRYFFDTSKKDAPKAIALASSGGHKNVVEYLLMNGISPNGISDDGKSALIYAIETSNKDIIELLIKYNVDINMPDDDDITPLMYAASVGDIEIVKKLLDNKASIKLVDNLGRNALTHAAMSGNITIIELLLDNGLTLKNKIENISLLMWAVIYDNLKSVKYLIQKGMDIKEKDKNGWNPFMFACAKGYMDIIEYTLKIYPNILAEKSKNNETALIIAADNEKIEVVDYLLSKGACIKEKNSQCRTALEIAIIKNNFEICELIINFYKINYANYNFQEEYNLAKEKGNKKIIDFIQSKL